MADDTENTGKTIDEVTPDTSIGGAEKIPVSDNGAAKSVTTAKIKDYVIDAIEALTAASSTTIAEDGIFIKQDGHIRPISAATLSDAIYARLFDKSTITAASLLDTDLISIEKNQTAKTTTIGALCDYVGEALYEQGMDIHRLSAAGDLDDNNYLAVEQEVTSQGQITYPTKKKKLSAIKDWILDKLGDVFSASTASFDDDDLLMFYDTTFAPRYVKFSNTGIGKGDVKGPNTTTENKIPQWDETTKTLKNGLTVATTITSTSSDTEVPTAAAVNTAVSSVASGYTSAPESTTENKIPQWDSTQKKLKDGLALDTTVSATYQNDNSVPSSKAVRTAINSMGNVKTEASGVTGYIPYWLGGDHAKTLTSGYQCVTSITNSSTDSQIPTAKAVYTEIGDIVKCSESTTNGKIPSWSVNQKTLTGGYDITTSVSSTSTDSQIPTAKAVKDMVSCSSITTANKIPTWGSDQHTLTDGHSVVNSISSTSTDSQIPTAKAVYDADSIKVRGPNSSEDEEIALFSGGTGKIIEGSGKWITNTDLSLDEDTGNYVYTAQVVNNLYKDAKRCIEQYNRTDISPSLPSYPEGSILAMHDTRSNRPSTLPEYYLAIRKSGTWSYIAYDNVLT